MTDTIVVEYLTGAQGAKGDTGEGVPTGGTTGKVLTKASGDDYDTEWTTVAGTGDMTKSVYDTDDSGVVDLAEAAPNWLEFIKTGNSAGDNDNWRQGVVGDNLVVQYREGGSWVNSYAYTRV